MTEVTNPKPEFGANPDDVTRFNAVVDAVAEHNDQFSMGAVMARALIGHVNVQKKAMELADEGLPEDEAEQTAEWLTEDEVPLTEQQQLEREIVGIMNADVTEAIGLALSPVRKTAIMFGPKGETTIGAVHFQLESGDKFVGFLSAAPLETADEKTSASVITVARDVFSEMESGIVSGEPTPAVTESLAYANGISDNLSRLPAADNELVQGFKDFSAHAETGDLNEWVALRQTGILTEPDKQGFGPSNWQIDATSTYLAKSWGRVLDAIKLAQHNPKATTLSKEAIALAKSNLAIAQADWQSRKDHYSNDQYGEGFDEVFATVAMELDELTEHESDK